MFGIKQDYNNIFAMKTEKVFDERVPKPSDTIVEFTIIVKVRNRYAKVAKSSNTTVKFI